MAGRKASRKSRFGQCRKRRAGKTPFIDSSAAKAAEDGRDGEPVTLTLDASLQFSVEEELRNSVRKASARAGSVIVMNSVNGEILAMANVPSYDPNQRGASPDRRRNRALTDGYEPGSTMKPVLLASALGNGMHLTDQVWGERGKFKIGGRTISEASSHEHFEWISLKRIIQVSSNIGAAKVALKLGADRYLATLKAFGFGNKTGTGFPGEISGRVPPRKSWVPITLANIGFGHGVLVTPIQMTRAYAAFLNGGWLVHPTLMKTNAQNASRPSACCLKKSPDKFSRRSNPPRRPKRAALPEMRCLRVIAWQVKQGPLRKLILKRVTTRAHGTWLRLSGFHYMSSPRS